MHEAFAFSLRCSLALHALIERLVRARQPSDDIQRSAIAFLIRAMLVRMKTRQKLAVLGFHIGPRRVLRKLQIRIRLLHFAVPLQSIQRALNTRGRIA